MKTKRHVVAAVLSVFSGMDVHARGSNDIVVLPAGAVLFSRELSSDAVGNGSGSNAG